MLTETQPSRDAERLDQEEVAEEESQEEDVETRSALVKPKQDTEMVSEDVSEETEESVVLLSLVASKL
jgi:hypothetical protein